MPGSVREGCLVLADIGGYTSYLAGVELEHSHDILADLLGNVAASLCPPLQLAKLEGDAVFCASAPEQPPSGESLLELLQRTYLSFARRRRTVALSSSCECEACRRTPQLDLKFCVHHGSFAEHVVAGSNELVGSDVILAHRLLKNRVAAEHGLHGYALITDSCRRALGIARALAEHSERYDDVGEIRCSVIDLDARWSEEQERSRDVVTREDSALFFEADVHASPQRVWEAMTHPAHGMRWRLGVDDVRERNPPSGRGVGTVTHCVHGRKTIEQEIVDWLPPLHYTFRERNPIGLCQWTVSLAPLAGGQSTHIEWRIALRGGVRQALVMRVAGRRVANLLRANFQSMLDHVERAVQPG